jgi:hypothetical protein
MYQCSGVVLLLGVIDQYYVWALRTSAYALVLARQCQYKPTPGPTEMLWCRVGQEGMVRGGATRGRHWWVEACKERQEKVSGRVGLDGILGGWTAGFQFSAI